MTRCKILIPIAAALALAAGCASSSGEPSRTSLAVTAEGEPDPRLGEEVNRLCFANSVNGFGETTRRSIVVNARANDHFLLETFGGCFNLDDAQRIGFDTFGASSCITRGDTLVTSDSVFGIRGAGGLGPQTCTIAKIYEWNPDAEAEEGDGGADEAAETEA